MAAGALPQQERRVLTVVEFHRLLKELPEEPARTMVIAAMCSGLRISELAALKWGDFDWRGSRLTVQRGIVDGHVGDVKTKYSRKQLPLDPNLARVFLRWRSQTPYIEDTDWVFASPFQNGKILYQPYHIHYTCGKKSRAWR